MSDAAKNLLAEAQPKGGIFLSEYDDVERWHAAAELVDSGVMSKTRIYTGAAQFTLVGCPSAD